MPTPGTPVSSKLHLRVPGSSANLGPGFDTLGLAVAVYVTVEASLSKPPSPPGITLFYTGDGAPNVSLVPAENLITQVALDVLARHDRALPGTVTVAVDNTVPLGRGLGSSGAAIVAGVLLAQWMGGFEAWSQEEVLRQCLVYEPHPDNVAPSLYGGCLTTVVDPQGDPIPAHIPVSSRIGAVALIPTWSLATSEARASLPPSYPRDIVVKNLQRIALLVASLGQHPPNPRALSVATEDFIHQPFRAPLVPGLEDLLRRLRHPHIPGVYTSFLSGAGPTVLILIDNEDPSVLSRISDLAQEILGDKSTTLQVGLDAIGAVRQLE